MRRSATPPRPGPRDPGPGRSAVGAAGRFGVALTLCLVSAGAGAGPPAARIAFDLDRLDSSGLQGPPDGRRALHYELCIPDRPEAAQAVTAIDPSLKIYRGPPGRVGCGVGTLLCVGHTHRPDYRAVLERLAALPFVSEIREAFFE